MSHTEQRLEAEIERLRAALRECVGTLAILTQRGGRQGQLAYRTGEVARRALDATEASR